MESYHHLPYNIADQSIAPHLRNNDDWCCQQLQNPSAQTIILYDNSILLQNNGTSLYLPEIQLSDAPTQFFSLLSLIDNQPILSFDLSRYLKSTISDFPASAADNTVRQWLDKHVPSSEKKYHSETLDFYPVRHGFMDLKANEIAMVSLALGLSRWHRSSSFCGICGERMKMRRGGFSSYCDDCSKEFFPRINPAVIMLVENNNQTTKKCLLAHHSRLPQHMFSTIAGFVDVGESIEHAVSREVYEELSLPVIKLDYIASQSWTFSSSLMMGFIATVEDEDFILDENELEYAQWFSSSELKQFGKSNTLYEKHSLSTEDSIARYLINYWLKHNEY